MKADSEKIMRLLKTARGQLDGIIKMVEEDRYCIDISNQILATSSILKKVNKDIIHAHMTNCVINAFGNNDAEEKLEEIIKIIDKLSK